MGGSYPSWISKWGLTAVSILIPCHHHHSSPLLTLQSPDVGNKQSGSLKAW